MWRRGGAAWPLDVVLYIESLPFSEEEVASFRDFYPTIGVWMKARDRYDSDNSDSDGDNCDCEPALSNLLLPCGSHLI